MRTRIAHRPTSDGKLEWFLGIGIVILTVQTVLMLAGSPPVLAAQTQPPPYSHSWYIVYPNPSPNGPMYRLGYYDGSWDGKNCTNSTVVLDYGQVANENGPGYDGFGTYDLNASKGYPFLADSQIVTATAAYARGWYNASQNCARLHIAIGTSNYHQCPYGGHCTPGGAGTQWGNVVNTVQQWLIAKGLAWQVTAWTGDDMEQPGGGQNWDCATPTRAFVDGFNGNNPSKARLLDYGSAWLPNNCWTTADVYYVAAGATYDLPLPGIYTGPATDSWINVRKQYVMDFYGVMTECNQNDPITGNYCTNPAGQFAPTGAWWDLWNKLNNNGLGQPSLDYATNIRAQ